MVAICHHNVKFFPAPVHPIETDAPAESSDGVQEHITGACRSSRYERLMPLVSCGVEAHRQQRPNQLPAPGPALVLMSEGAMNEDGEDEILAQMAEFSNQQVYDVELMPGDRWHDPRQNGADDLGCLGRGERRRRKAEYDYRPYDDQAPIDPLTHSSRSNCAPHGFR